MDVPWLMALDALREQGYTVEVVPFAKSSLVPPALERGDVHVADTNTSPVWAAVAQGADIRTIVGKSNVSYVVVSTDAIRDCQELDGKSITFSTRQSVGYVLFERHVTQHCPGIRPEVILISQSSSRVAALQAEQVTAAYMDLEDWLQLKTWAPGRFRVLIDLGREFPDVCFTAFSVRRDWAEQNPGMVRDVIRELVVAYRAVLADPQALADGIVRYLEYTADQAGELSAAYRAANIWDANGFLTRERVELTLQLLRETGLVTGDVLADDVADLSYLSAVLDEIGRR